ASTFWEAAGMREPFPRSLREPIARALPMMLIFLPRLRLEDVRQWLIDNQRGWPCATAVTARARDGRVRGCLVAWRGWGCVFLDGADAEDEQRFSLAHELAHFLKHYWRPRREAVRRLGRQVLEVFDGLRPATPAEQLHGLLSGSGLGFHVHL